MTFLVLGGTRYARDLAVSLQQSGMPVTCAQYGAENVRPPVPPVDLIAGGFGGVDEMVAFLLGRTVHGVVDASHPFAPLVTRQAMAAAVRTGVPLVRLLPPAWEAQPWPRSWRWVDDEAGAKRAAEQIGGTRPFLSLGRDSLRDFAGWDDRYVLARVLVRPTWQVPAGWEVLRSTGLSHSYVGELTLLSSRRIDVMVTQDTGGSLDAAKLRVAERLGIFVVMIRRPALPEGLRVVQTVEAAHAWALRHWRPQDY